MWIPYPPPTFYLIIQWQSIWSISDFMAYRRTKISHDPNNVNWTRSTSGFGHKILSSQGWTPGSFLGARNAAHADMFTAASASHIKVSVKDDTLGLGARPKRDALDEPTGLDAFKGLLGRLNGKSDAELETEQRKRDDIKLARYAATKWQTVRFIRGGLLVQEKLDYLPKTPENHSRQTDQSGASTDDKSHATGNGHTAIDKPNSSDSQAVSKASKKKSSRSKRSDEETKSQKKREKREKREGKTKKRKHSEDSTDLSSRMAADGVGGNEQTAPHEHKATSTTATPVSKERRPMGRNIIRGRHIAQKKRALLDDKSLNEVIKKSEVILLGELVLIVG